MYYKKLRSLIAILLLGSCVNNNKDTLEVNKLSSPINIKQFLTNNQQIDTFKLQTDILNKKFDFNHMLYNHYEALNTNVNKNGMFRYNDYLVTGKDIAGNETVICFYTQNEKEGNKLWKKSFINQPKEKILAFFDHKINDDSYPLKYYYGVYKNGYNIVLHTKNDTTINSFLIFKSDKILSVRQTITQSNNLNYFDRKAPD